MYLTPEDREFVRKVRQIIIAISTGGLASAAIGDRRMTEILAERGLAPDCHLGRKDLENTISGVEWYAGQLHGIISENAWYAMNSYINAIDRFAPETWT